MNLTAPSGEHTQKFFKFAKITWNDQWTFRSTCYEFVRKLTMMLDIVQDRWLMRILNHSLELLSRGLKRIQRVILEIIHTTITSWILDLFSVFANENRTNRIYYCRGRTMLGSHCESIKLKLAISFLRLDLHCGLTHALYYLTTNCNTLMKSRHNRLVKNIIL